MRNRLYQHYLNVVTEELMLKYQYDNVNEIPSIEKIVLNTSMKTYTEMNLDNLTESEFITELSLGKISSTVLLSRVVMLTRKLDDKKLGEVIKYVCFLIYTVSLQQQKKRKDQNQSRPIRSKINWRHLK